MYGKAPTDIEAVGVQLILFNNMEFTQSLIFRTNGKYTVHGNGDYQHLL